MFFSRRHDHFHPITMVINALIIGCLMLALVGWLSVMMVRVVLAHDTRDTAQLSPDMRQWFDGLRNRKKESCCSTSDGWKPQAIEWDYGTARYRVLLDGQWLDVPPDVVLEIPNRYGEALVWTFLENGRKAVRCFLPGAGG